jgi:hypothetical protein
VQKQHGKTKTKLEKKIITNAKIAQLKEKIIIKKDEVHASFYSFSFIPNPKQHLRLTSQQLLFRNLKMECYEN